MSRSPTRANGFGGADTELLIANDVVVRHLTALAEWQKTKIFDYGGRADRADAKFHGSQCGMYVSSSATRPTFWRTPSSRSATG